MAKAKDKTTKRKRTPTAKAAAAAPTVAPARAGKKPKKKSAKPTGAAQLPVETQETATLDHIVWDPPETTDTGSQDVDTWDMSDLARAALALPEEFKAEVDAAWNAADTAKALRDILRRHAEASDEFTGLPLCDLARRAATLPETLRGQVDAAFGSNNIEEALRKILRAASSSATQVAAEADSEEADSEEDDTSDKDDAMASLNAMMASELRKASASATPAARAAHQATAQMIQVQIQAGGEKDGKGGKPRKAKSPSQIPRESGRPTGGARVPDFWAVRPGPRDSPQADVPGPRGPKRLFCSKYLARACVTGCCPRCPLASDWHNTVR